MAFLVEPNNITVDYEEMNDSPRESLSHDRISATRTLKCAWTNRLQLAKELIGYTQVSGSDSILYQPHPYAPLDNVVAVEVSISPFAGIIPDPTSVKDAEYRHAFLTVKYETPSYDLPTEGQQTYVTESLEPAAEFLTLTHDKLFWDTNGETLIDSTEAPARVIRMLDWVYTINRISYLPSEVFDLPGCVNKYDIYSWSLNRWFAWETLLCGNPSLRRETTSEGTTAWTVTFRFTYRNAGTFASPLGWNVFPRPGQADAQGHIYYDSIKTESGNDILVYEPKDFEGLII